MFPTPVCGPAVYAPGSVALRVEDYVAGACSGEWSVDDARCNRTYTNRLKLEIATQYIGPAQVIALSGVRIGDTYRFPLYASAPTEADTGSFVQSIHAERAAEHGPGGQCQWIITIEYSPFDVVHNLGTSNIATGIVNPTDRVPEVYWDSAKYKYSRVQDFDSPQKPYLNSIGDPLLDVPEFEETRPVLKIVRNEPKYYESIANSYRDTVNGDTFLGCSPNTVKCRDIKGERDYDPDWGYFYKITYEFEFRVDPEGKGFTQQVLNAGYRYKKNGTGNPINAVDDNGQQVTDAIALTKSGDKLAAGAAPYFLEFVEFPQMPFQSLLIPDDIFQADM